MTTPSFTILLPIVRPPLYLEASVATIQAQTLQDFELFIVCDGAPASTVEAAMALGRADQRIRVLARSKGERHGELHRHEALAMAAGTLVCHIDDDALWFPDHLATMAALLHNADFGHTTHARIHENGSITFLPGNLNDVSQRGKMASAPYNWIGLVNAGYRVDAYRKLPEGWSPAPPDVWSDLWMWRKFIAEPLAFASSLRITGLFLHREKNDATPLAVSQHARLANAILRAGSTVQAEVERAFHRLIWERVQGGAALGPMTHPPIDDFS